MANSIGALGVLVGTVALSAIGCGCSSTSKGSTSMDGAVGGTGGISGTGGGGSGGIGGQSTGGVDGLGGLALGGRGGTGGQTSGDVFGGTSGSATGGVNGSGGTAGRDGGVVDCPADVGALSRTFCVGLDVYRAISDCPDGGPCRCVGVYGGHCFVRCVTDPDYRGICGLPEDAGATDAAPDVAPKLDSLTIPPPDGTKLDPPCAKDQNGHFRDTFCYGNGVYYGGLACPAGGECDCVSDLESYCAHTCVDLPNGRAECE